MIQFENVGLRYGTGPEVLHDVSFRLERGSFHFLTGRSGAGKTSLLKLMYLGWRPTRGLINMFGEDLAAVDRKQLPAMRRRVGVIFQDFRLLNHMSVFDNVALPLRIAGVAPKQIQQNVNELIDWVGLGDFKDAKPATLSGGQQQRVAIARAVINRPSLILADEPTGNVDERIGLRLLHLFEELNKLGTTLVIATHDRNLIKKFQYPRLHLNNGTLQVKDPLGKTTGGTDDSEQ